MIAKRRFSSMFFFLLFLLISYPNESSSECIVKEGAYYKSPSIIMENELIRVTIVPELNGRIVEYFLKPAQYNHFLPFEAKRIEIRPGVFVSSQSNFGGYEDWLWNNKKEWGKGHGPFGSNYSSKVLEKNPAFAKVLVWCQEGDYKIEREMTIYEKSTILDIDVNITCLAKTPDDFSYWSHIVANDSVISYGDADISYAENDIQFVPVRKTPQPVQKLSITVEKDMVLSERTNLWMESWYPPGQSWWARVDTKRKFVFAEIVPIEELLPDGLYYRWQGDLLGKKRISQEIIYATKHFDNNTHRFHLALASIMGMEKISYISRHLALYLDTIPVKVFQKGEKIPTSFVLSSPQKIGSDYTLKTNLIHNITRKGYSVSEILVSGLEPTRVIKENFFLDTSKCSEGKYKIECQLLKGDEIIENFEILGYEIDIKE